MVAVSGADCYALRCAYLHNGTDEFSGPAARHATFSRIEFTVGQVEGAWAANALRAGEVQIAQIPHEKFCRDMIGSAEGWRRARSEDRRVTEAIVGLMQMRIVGA
jgi:hypothetical protein